MASFVFDLPNATDCTGLLPGQYVEVQCVIDGVNHTRYFSPVSPPNSYGNIEIVIRFESSGMMSKYFKELREGESLEFRGPCGGFEYIPNSLKKLTLIASGGGITPGLQLIRSILSNPKDRTEINLIYYSDSYKEILYREELDNYAAKDKRMKIVHTLGETTENWEGYEGFIDTQILQENVEMGLPNTDHKVVICGGPTMVVSCLFSLRTLQLPSQQIFIYGQFGTEQMRTVYGPNVKLSSHRSDGTQWIQ